MNYFLCYLYWIIIWFKSTKGYGNAKEIKKQVIKIEECFK